MVVVFIVVPVVIADIVTVVVPVVPVVPVVAVEAVDLHCRSLRFFRSLFLCMSTKLRQIPPRTTKVALK